MVGTEEEYTIPNSPSPMSQFFLSKCGGFPNVHIIVLYIIQSHNERKIHCILKISKQWGDDLPIFVCILI